MKLHLKKHRETILYLFFGAATTVVNLILYTVTVSIGVSMVLSNTIAWFGAVFFAFVTNKAFVFNSSSWTLKIVLKEGVSFFGVRLFSGLIEIIMPTILFYMGLNQKIFGVEGFLAKIVVSVFVTILNYFLSKIIVFRKK